MLLTRLFPARRRAAGRANPAPLRPRFRPLVEGMEDRVVPAAPVLDAAQVAPAAATDLINITGVNLTNVRIVDGVLTAAGTVTGTLTGLPFTTQITNFTLQLIQDDPTTPQRECPVLNLELGPIDLDLLGLHVDTSPICLEVTATQGGGLLGDLLCGLAGNLTNLSGVVQQILGNIFGQASSNVGPAQGGQDICDGECEILDLALGPVDLTLLGLNVRLDNCADGPVQVCVSASRGEGLLGDLLCGLSGFPNLNLDLGEIAQIADRALDLLADGGISGRDIGELTSLVNRLARR